MFAGPSAEEGIAGHTALIAVATEALNLLDATVEAAAQGTEVGRCRLTSG